MKWSIFILSLFALFFVACGPKKEELIQTAIAETQLANPTSTMTPTLTPTHTTTQTSTPTLTLTPTLTPTDTHTPTPTPDLQVIILEPREFLLETRDLPSSSLSESNLPFQFGAVFRANVGCSSQYLGEKRVKVGRFCEKITLSDKLLGRYYMPSGGMSSHLNSEIISGWGSESGKDYLAETGRVTGYWSLFFRGTSTVKMPEEAFCNFIQYKNHDGATLIITKYSRLSGGIQGEEKGWIENKVEMGFSDVEESIYKNFTQPSGNVDKNIKDNCDLSKLCCRMLWIW